MEKLKKFEELNPILPDNFLVKITGGASSSKTYRGEDGCMHYYTDEYQDCNGDGDWDANEPGTSCEDVVCDN